MSFQIAIDGPVAAGKGTVAKLVAERLNLLYIDTGAMYRTAALLAHRNQIPIEDEQKIAELVKNSEIDMHNPSPEEQDGRLTTVLLNGEDISWAIRTPEVSANSSKVAALPEVRKVLVEKQQHIAEQHDVIMEGRDITFKVLPTANIKIFLTANDETRAKRRFMELQMRGQDVTFEQVYEDLQERDKRDKERSTDPLHITEDAWVIDTSSLTIDEVIDLIETRARQLRSK